MDSLPAELSALRGAGYDQEDFTSQGWGRKIPGEGVAPAKAEKPKGQLCRGVCFRADRGGIEEALEGGGPQDGE